MATMARTRQTGVPVLPLGPPTKGKRSKWLLVKRVDWWFDERKCISLETKGSVFNLGYCLCNPKAWHHREKNKWFYVLELTRASCLLSCESLQVERLPATFAAALEAVGKNSASGRGLLLCESLICLALVETHLRIRGQQPRQDVLDKMSEDDRV